MNSHRQSFVVRIVLLAAVGCVLTAPVAAQNAPPARPVAQPQPSTPAPAQPPAQPAAPAQAPGQPPVQPPSAAPAPPPVSPPFTSPRLAPPAPRAGQGQDDYKIGPEDILDISVWRNTDLTRTVSVRPDGKISLPLLNDIQAADLTPTQLRDTLAKGYAEFVSTPEVSVIVHEIHSVKVSVVGMVKNPGRYELKSRATILEALALAGGLNDFAKKDRIVAFRHAGRGWTKLPFNYSRVLSEWDEKENFALEPGDIIVVP
jgi:polysaccharide export outer membrane protein